MAGGRTRYWPRGAPKADRTTSIDPSRTSDTDAATRLDTGPIDASEIAIPKLARGELVGGRYRIDGLLGKGGFGEVYRVTDVAASGRALALKMHRVAGTSGRALDAIRGEFALLASLSHPNLATVHDFGWVGDDVAFFTQTLVTGTTLSEAIGAGGRVEVASPRGVRLLAQLCRALDYLHSRGILHRDIKPSNVLVDLDRDHLTLLDFGIAKAFGAQEEDLIVGTHAYMAPEMLIGGAIDARSDLYAVGVTLFRLLTGELPFPGSGSRVLMAQVHEPPPPMPASAAAPALAALVSRLLAKDPGARPASAGELLRELAGACGVQVETDTRESLASYVLSAQFVGREAPLASIVGAATSKAARPLLIVGEAGTGKSRLLREARQRLQLAARGWLTLDVHRVDAPAGLVHRFADAILTPGVVAQLDEDDRRELARTVPRLRRRGERSSVVVDPERARDRLVAALGEALRFRFEPRPGVVAVEDLHWLPPDVVDLLGRVVTEAVRRSASCTFVVTARPGPAAETFARSTEVEPIPVFELEPDAIGRLVESMFGDARLLDGTGLGAALASGAHSALWVQESLRLAIDRGAIVRRGGVWNVRSAIDAEPIGGVLAARVASLPREAKRIALSMAVLGRPASVAEIAAVSARTLPRAAPAVRALVRSGIAEDRVDADGHAEYAMHDRFVDAVLETAVPEDARAAHLRAARALGRGARSDWRAHARASLHFERAEDLEAAADSAERAVSSAEDAGRLDVAVELHVRRLELLAASRRVAIDRLPLELLLERHDLARASGDKPALEAALRDLARARHGADVAGRVAIAQRFAAADMRAGKGRAARRRALAALSVARAARLRVREIELLVLMVDIDNQFGDVARGFAAAADAAKAAAGAGERRLEARASHLRALLALRADRPEEAFAPGQRAVELARAIGDHALLSESFAQLGSATRETGDLRKSVAFYRRGLVAARRAGAPEIEAKILTGLGITLQWIGRVDEVEAVCHRAIAMKRRIGAEPSALISENNLGSVLIASGALAEGRALLERVLEATRRDNPVVVATVLSNLGDVALIERRLDDAVALFREAEDFVRARTIQAQAVHTVMGLVRALAMRQAPGDLDATQARLEYLRSSAAGASTSARIARRYHVTAAMVADAAGEHGAMVAHARAAMKQGADAMDFFGVVGTPLEARWVNALAAARSGRSREVSKWIDRCRKHLERLAAGLADPARRARFLEGHPMRRAILEGRVATEPGWTW